MGIEIGLVQGYPYPIMPGQIVQLYGLTQPRDRKLLWRIEHRDPGLNAAIKSLGEGAFCLFKAEETCRTGWVVVSASDVEYPERFAQAAIYVGCPNCGSCEREPEPYVTGHRISFPYGKKNRTRVIPNKINGLYGKNGGFFTCRPKSL